MYNRGNRGAAGGAAAATSEDQLESQNEMMLGNLHSRISNLKNITIAIGDEVREQNKALEMMQNGMMSTDNLIGSTLNKMQTMYKSHGSMSIVYLSIFCLVVFFAVYSLMKMGF
uniref:t-SNARE coiled-coil homology domain-containing protein n=1 Tax=Hanusia phi TaxID=3032 RepID=A0A7S0DV34_9CRYP|mmetsp:Transcript_10979/g.24901  ORF Transcript_10979/g.24901 Transcript_10979/m.24901 type:complete len:114 (+) Transcript_10979:121-462(+)